MGLRIYVVEMGTQRDRLNCDTQDVYTVTDDFHDASNTANQFALDAEDFARITAWEQGEACCSIETRGKYPYRGCKEPWIWKSYIDQIYP